MASTGDCPYLMYVIQNIYSYTTMTLSSDMGEWRGYMYVLMMYKTEDRDRSEQKGGMVSACHGRRPITLMSTEQKSARSRATVAGRQDKRLF